MCAETFPRQSYADIEANGADETAFLVMESVIGQSEGVSEIRRAKLNRWQDIMGMLIERTDNSTDPEKGVHLGNGVHIRYGEKGQIFVEWHGVDSYQLINSFRSPAYIKE